MSARSSPLQHALDALEALYGRPAPHRADPFEQVLLESVAYLVSDAQREKAFGMLRERVGLTPDAILHAKPSTLLAISEQGGMHPQARVARLLQCAEIVASECRGDLHGALQAAPLPAAHKLLEKFPGIGAPGADKILLFAGLSNGFALESNGLRVLLRLGCGEAQKSYAKTYRTVMDATLPELPSTGRGRVRAYLLLRKHGQELCKRSQPRCIACPLVTSCAFANASLGD